jgi:hypothetical protein
MSRNVYYIDVGNYGRKQVEEYIAAVREGIQNREAPTLEELERNVWGPADEAEHGIKLTPKSHNMYAGVNLGPGSVNYRFTFLMRELENRFPNPAPYRSDRMPEQAYLEAIDALLADTYNRTR